MANSHTLVEDFAAGRPFRKSLSSRTSYGTLRLSYNETYFYSYRMKLAYRDPQGNVIINGDGAPSVTTRKHQRLIRILPGPQIPFSVLERLNTPVEEIRIVHAKSDFVLLRKVLCTGTDDKPCWRENHETHHGRLYHFVEEHFLGETLFEHGGDLYISGLDRNEPPRSRHFYVVRLPAGCEAKTVDAGLEALRPSHVPESALRQGEWFFVPTDHKTAGKLVKSLHLVGPLKEHIHKSVPLDDRPGRHVVSQLIASDGRRFASGVVRDQQHATLKLPDVWHEVVRNLSRGGFSIDASNRVNVD